MAATLLVLACFWASCAFAEEIVPAALLEKARAASDAEAVEQYRVLARDYSRSAIVWYEFGNALYDTKNWPEALQAYEQCAKLGFKPAAIQTRIGKSLEKLKRYAEAEAAFRKALEADRDAIAARFGLASSLFYQRKNSDAATIFEELSKRDDSWGEVSREFLAETYYDAARYDEVIALCGELLKRNPQDAALHWLSGRALFKKKKYAEAMPHFQQVAESDSKRREAALYYVAASMEGAGRRREAETAYRDVGRANSTWGEAARKEAKRLAGAACSFILDYTGGFDTNVIRNNPDATSSGKQDGFNQIFADIQGRVLRSEPLNIWLGAEHYGLHYLELHGNDYIQDSVKSAFNFPKVGPFNVVSVRYQLNYSELNGDRYRLENRIDSSAVYQRSKERLVLGLYYGDNRYFEPFEGVGGPEYGAYVDYRHKLPNRDHELRLRLNSEWRFSHSETEERTVQRARLQYRTHLISGLFGQLEAQYRRADYPHSSLTIDGVTLSRRTDDRWSGELMFDWQVQTHISVNWGYVFERQESTRTLEKYSRHQGSAGITLRF